MSTIQPGEVGHYPVDGETCYGTYIRISDNWVFVDIKQDGRMEQRIVYAKRLAASGGKLGAALEKFYARNADYVDRAIGSIGLHSAEDERGEVFWDPDGYTLLRGVVFEDP